MTQEDFNHDAVSAFWQENDLMNDRSVIRFDCTFEITTQSDRSFTNNIAMIWLDAGSINKVEIMDFHDDPKLFPTDFWLSKGVIKNNRNVLTIDGVHPNPTIGIYKAVITALGKSAL